MSLQDERKMARFAQYAMAASEEALEDSGWKPTEFEKREATVCIVLLIDMTSLTVCQGVCLGSGIGNFDEIYDTVVAYDKGVSTSMSTIQLPC